MLNPLRMLLSSLFSPYHDIERCNAEWWGTATGGGVPHHPASPVTVEAAVQEFFSSFRAKAWRAVDGQAGKRCFFFYFYSIKRLDRLAPAVPGAADHCHSH